MNFPKDFIWGTATSAYQIEGAYNRDGKGVSIWDTFCHTPGKINDNETGDIACDHYDKYEDDIKLLKSLHMDSFRTSMQWSRLLTKDGKLNQEGAQFYHKVCKCAKENQIELCIILICRPICLKEADGKAGMWWKLMQPMPEPLFVSLVQRSGTGLLSTNPS